MTADLEHSVMRKTAWRLVPFLGLAHFIDALYRFNISIAALHMNKALGLSATTYGLGAGAFFWSYVLPANAVLTRLGARKWLAFIMVFWERRRPAPPSSPTPPASSPSASFWAWPRPGISRVSPGS